MSEALQTKILALVKSDAYRPQRPRNIAKELQLADDFQYPSFREALRELMHAGRVILGARGAVILPTQQQKKNEIVGTYRHNKRGFGFVVPSDPAGHEDLFIPPGDNNGAITGDIVSSIITSRGNRDGKAMFTGRVAEIIERSTTRFVGTLAKERGSWIVNPDGNVFTGVILTPDAGSRHIKVGTKVVVEVTSYPTDFSPAVGVIVDVLGTAGEKDVDLKSIIIQHNLPGDFPEEVLAQARRAKDSFDPAVERERRLDLTDHIVATIDPDDAKDYDDAISLRQLDGGLWELGVHIADVSFFVKPGTPLDVEAEQRGNSCYFPGRVIPMLPEVLSNGVCSLQEGVPRLCKSAFITLDEDARPVRTKFLNTIIHSNKRLRYTEAQAIIDGKKEIPHPDGAKKISDYDRDVIDLLKDMDKLARRIQKRRQAAGQLTLELPEVELVLDEEGKVVDTRAEDTSYTHTIIEMFMVEANEAVARMLNSVGVPFLRRVHPTPEMDSSERLKHFVTVSGHKLPAVVDRRALQILMASVRGKPESFAISLAVLKSLTRAEYSPVVEGHYALASDHYCHFTSPIRRYADLTIHRLLDAYFEARDEAGMTSHGKRKKIKSLENIPTYDDLVQLGKHISFTERRAEDAERELRKVKILELLAGHIGDEFEAVVTGITNFGLFVQIHKYLIDGLIRYEDLLDDWWDVDERGGLIRGQRTGQRIGIGDACTVIVVKVDPPRRELDLSITKIVGRPGGAPPANAPKTGPRGGGSSRKKTGGRGPANSSRGGSSRPQGGGSRPQSGGSRPQGSGSRPQGGGSRPQGGGSRPEGGGSRPQGGGSRPEGGGRPKGKRGGR